MNQSTHVLTVPDVRAKLDQLIAAVELRADNLEVAAREPSKLAGVSHFQAMHEHYLGRIHGLKEARELLDALEAPTPL